MSVELNLEQPGYSVDSESSDFSSLYESVRIGSMAPRNRFVQSPIFTQFATAGGEVDDSLIEYYRSRAHGGVG